jgi:predicted dinucleotide-binding enzyme
MARENVAVLGSGIVGEVLADGFLKHGYNVMRASRDPGKLADWKSRGGDKASTGTFQEGVAFGDVVVLAVKGTASESAVRICSPANLRGKTVIDATNPIADEAPVNGVLKFFTDINRSLMEWLQELAPEAHFVKAFSCVGNALMVNPSLPGGKPTMFICGNHAGAKERVKEILSRFGWETEDMGAVEAARAIEPLCMLWCIPGLARNQWNHAFKLLRG